MDDTISRQAAIDYCYQLINVEYQQGSDEMNYGQERVNQTETILHHLELMPSVQPERKKGKWDFMGWQMFQCSECKHTFTQDFLEGWRGYTYEPFFPPFCPNCGADMR